MKTLSLLAVTLMLVLPAGANADVGPFVLPAAGCPMAHCDARMSDNVAQRSPAVGQEVRVLRNSAGAVGGLGCVSNTRLVACTGSADPTQLSNLSVYDADGNLVWEDGGILNATAWYGAAMISDTDQVIAADQRTLLRADPRTGTILWQSSKPDDGTPISPVLVGSDASMILLATKSDAGVGTPELSIWDAATGALLSHQSLTDPVTGALYGTINTPAVKGNRAYVLAAGVGAPDNGRLYAIDVCESEACGGRGKLQIVWHHPFDGPASASPLRIGDKLFFDGLRGRNTGLFYRVDDLGNSASEVWKKSFTGRFGASAAQDPRGGLWFFPWQSGQLLRVSERNGTVQQTLDVSTVLGLAAGYSPVTALSISSSASDAVVLTFGTQNKSTSVGNGPHVAAIDVSSTATGTALWAYRVSGNALRLAPTGQYPIVVNAAGARRVVFRGTTSGTFFVGEP